MEPWDLVEHMELLWPTLAREVVFRNNARTFLITMELEGLWWYLQVSLGHKNQLKTSTIIIDPRMTIIGDRLLVYSYALPNCRYNELRVAISQAQGDHEIDAAITRLLYLEVDILKITATMSPGELQATLMALAEAHNTRSVTTLSGGAPGLVQQRRKG